MTLDDDHGALPRHVEALNARLDSLSGQLVHGKAAHVQHMQFAERCRLLADHLRAAVMLADKRHYASALVIVRTALEHHLIDRLLFLADRYQQVYAVRKENVAAEEGRLASLKAGPRPDIDRWFMDNGRMNVVVRGIYSNGSLGRGRTLSPYYIAIEHYDPFTGRPHLQAQLAAAFTPVQDRRGWALESKSVWDSLFTYPKLRRNLLLNRLISQAQAVQLDAHYGFLSAYVHPASKAYDLVYGHNLPSTLGSYDHYAGELVLLYAATVAVAELTAFDRMTRQSPRVGLRDWPAIQSEIAAAERATDYFWFLHGAPQAIDRINEVHTRLARRKFPWKIAVTDPSALAKSRVRYYRNPLVRLIELHRGFRELTTGLGFASPFPRADARWRI